MATNNFIYQTTGEGESYLNFYEQKLNFVSMQNSQPTISYAGSNTRFPSSQHGFINNYEQGVIGNYIAPQRNKHIFGVKIHGDEENNIFFGPNYSYRADAIPEYSQEVIVHYEGEGGSCDCSLYWQDLIRTS